MRTVTSNLVLPNMAERLEATRRWGNQQAHDHYQAQWPCLNSIELQNQPATETAPRTLMISAWNIERCKHIAESADLIRRVGADIVLASEMDLGMARSGQHHTTRELASQLDYSYAFAVEFVELGLGDARETADCDGLGNLHGLHGNAILSRWPLRNVVLLPLDAGGYWFVQAPKNDGQYRVGGRMAIAAQIDTLAGPLTLVCTHYESESDADGRALQTQTLLDGLDTIYGNTPAVIGGDLNTNAFMSTGTSPDDMLNRPNSIEPSFTHFEKHGFDWRNANTGRVTTRLNPDSTSSVPLKTLDWLFVRGISAYEPFVTPALTPNGEYLSDHELIGTQIRYA
ncbi:MAG: endonuclease/exonuclease/phosphatase family protein [Granulosicoccus sp.]|nr:endonuclease/exonuclease/phosphatase family protein [Granulosicoccus sp.]